MLDYLTSVPSALVKAKTAIDPALAAAALAAVRAAGVKIDSIADLSRLGDADAYEQELIIAAEVRAYFQVAYKVSPFPRYHPSS